MKSKTKVFVHDQGSTIILPCGIVVEGCPREDQGPIAFELGYGGDLLAMVQDHDPLHVALCDWLGVESRAMRVAAGLAADDELARLEEAAVIAVQKFMRRARAVA